MTRAAWYRRVYLRSDHWRYVLVALWVTFLLIRIALNWLRVLGA